MVNKHLSITTTTTTTTTTTNNNNNSNTKSISNHQKPIISLNI